jgi:hypothetical protein
MLFPVHLSYSSTLRIRPSGLFSSDLICNYRCYRHLVLPLGWVISPIARPLPAQYNTNTEETRADIHASSGIRTNDSTLRAGEDISSPIPRVHCDRSCKIIILFILELIFSCMTREDKRSNFNIHIYI